MDIDDLIIIGKLGLSQKQKDWIQFQINPDFQDYLKKIEEIFLIFKDHRVRYVKVEKIAKRDNKLFFRIQDKDVADELTNQAETLIAVDPETLEGWQDEEGLYDPIGMQVIWKEQVIGEVTDWFNNGAQDVFVITLNNGNEIMIPDVEVYITEIDTETRRILCQEIEDFLEL